MGVWIRGWRGSNFSVGGMASVGLKNFGAGSVGGVVPKILVWITWVEFSNLYNFFCHT